MACHSLPIMSTSSRVSKSLSVCKKAAYIEPKFLSPLLQKAVLRPNSGCTLTAWVSNDDIFFRSFVSIFCYSHAPLLSLSDPCEAPHFYQHNSIVQRVQIVKDLTFISGTLLCKGHKLCTASLLSA